MRDGNLESIVGCVFSAKKRPRIVWSGRLDRLKVMERRVLIASSLSSVVNESENGGTGGPGMDCKRHGEVVEGAGGTTRVLPRRTERRGDNATTYVTHRTTKTRMVRKTNLKAYTSLETRSQPRCTLAKWTLDGARILAQSSHC